MNPRSMAGEFRWLSTLVDIRLPLTHSINKIIHLISQRLRAEGSVPFSGLCRPCGLSCWLALADQ